MSDETHYFGDGHDHGPDPSRTAHCEAIARLLHERCAPPWMDHWEDLEPEVREGSEWWVIADAVLALVRPVDGVTLTSEEAVLAARCARSFRGDRARPTGAAALRSLEPGSVYEQLRLLAEKCEQAT